MYTTSSIRNIWDLEDICALPARHVIMCIKSVMAWPNISFLLEMNLFFLHQVFTRVIKLQNPFVIFSKTNLINKRHGSQILELIASRPNHTSHTNVYFNESVANVLRDNIGIVIFDLRGHRGCWRPKSSLRGQKWHEEVDSLKNLFNKSFSTTSKLLSRSNQIWATTSG